MPSCLFLLSCVFSHTSLTFFTCFLRFCGWRAKIAIDSIARQVSECRAQVLATARLPASNSSVFSCDPLVWIVADVESQLLSSSGSSQAAAVSEPTAADASRFESLARLTLVAKTDFLPRKERNGWPHWALTLTRFCCLAPLPSLPLAAFSPSLK